MPTASIRAVKAETDKKRADKQTPAHAQSVNKKLLFTHGTGGAENHIFAFFAMVKIRRLESVLFKFM